nr:MAG TPA: hypothetical protein [Caudoviricetes sp.]
MSYHATLYNLFTGGIIIDYWDKKYRKQKLL